MAGTCKYGASVQIQWRLGACRHPTPTHNILLSPCGRLYKAKRKGVLLCRNSHPSVLSRSSGRRICSFSFRKMNSGDENGGVTAASAVLSSSSAAAVEAEQQKLKKGIAEFYDESSGIWEDIWGDHMHHGFYEPQASASLSDHRAAQIRMIEEALRFASVSGWFCPCLRPTTTRRSFRRTRRATAGSRQFLFRVATPAGRPPVQFLVMDAFSRFILWLAMLLDGWQLPLEYNDIC